MSDTRVNLCFTEKPVDTMSSTENPDEIIEEYIKCLENIFEEDEEVRTIVETNYLNNKKMLDN